MQFFIDVWKNVKHRANEASNDGHRPPLGPVKCAKWDLMCVLRPLVKRFTVKLQFGQTLLVENLQRTHSTHSCVWETFDKTWKYSAHHLQFSILLPFWSDSSFLVNNNISPKKQQQKPGKNFQFFSWAFHLKILKKEEAIFQRCHFVHCWWWLHLTKSSI